MKNKLNLKFKDKKIVLASGSPRRKELLNGLDIPFIVETKEVNEVYPENLVGREITEHLALLKAEAFTNVDNDTVIITADTIVWHQNKAVMKPKNRREAIEILTSLSDTSHEVYTSVCLKSNKKTQIFSERTKVSFEKLSLDEIEYYIDTYKPYDKAGAYGAQDWIGFIAIKKLEGSYFNVMGLPVHKLYKELVDF
ncbi:MAG TPA: septum formation protein Maf [Lutibacter sp.]|nr:septum formation protein Maf [Lutibacter sp.]